MKLRLIVGALALGNGLWGQPQANDEVQLELSAESSVNIRTGDRGVQAYLTPVGPLQSRIRAGRVTLSHAMDDTGAVLTQSTTGQFYSVSVGRVDDSKDLTSREPTPFSLWGLSKDAKALQFVAGVLELVIPDLDPASIVVVDHIAAKFGSPIASGSLTRENVTLTLYDRQSADAAAGAKTPGGPQDYDSGPLYGASNRFPTAFAKPVTAAGDIAVGIDDPKECLIGLEFQAADGSPLPYNHGGYYHSSGLTGSPGKRFDVYHLGDHVPGDTRVVCWLVTSKSLLRIPFHIDALPLPAAGEGRRRLALMSVRVDAAVLRTRAAMAYDASSGNTKAASATPIGTDKIARLWSDVPVYVAFLKEDIHYNQLPRLVASVPPEIPPASPMAPHTTARVLVSFAVDDKGGVEAARALESEDARFNLSAVEAVLQWRFRPAESNGHPTMAFVTVPIIFKAPDPDQPGLGPQEPRNP